MPKDTPATPEVDYAALISRRLLTAVVPITLGDGVAVGVKLQQVLEEDLWAMEQRWKELPDDVSDPQSDTDLLEAAFVGFVDAEGASIPSLDLASLRQLMQRLNRGERRRLVAKATELAATAPDFPFSPPPSATTGSGASSS